MHNIISIVTKEVYMSAKNSSESAATANSKASTASRTGSRRKGIMFILTSAFFFSLMTVFVRLSGDVRDHADLAEGARREAKWREAGYYIISMKNDFKTIYGAGVLKTDFIFP